MAVSKSELVREMCRAIQEGNAAVFGGAGLSRPSGYVDWKGLLRPLAESINLDVDKEQDLLAVAQFYRNQRGNRAAVNQRIIAAFSESAETNENVRILSKLPIFTYWTTNYDNLIEEGIRQANRNPDVKSEPEQLAVSRKDRDAVVYKMHGDATNPAHAVLTKDDYEMYEYRRPLFRTALQGDLISKTFLFIGFSFEDPNLDYVLSQIHSLLGEDIHDHYCFFKRVQRNDYTSDKDYGYDLAKQDYREEDLRRYGIQTCFVESYDEITDILHEIEKAVYKRNIFISGSVEEFTDPWPERRAFDLAGHMANVLVNADYRITSGFGLGIGSAVINGALDAIYSAKYRHMDEHLCLRPFPQNYSTSVERAQKHEKYRKDMLEDVGIAIFLFGNKRAREPDGKDTIVNADGCRKEFEIARENGIAVIPLGSTGYMAKELFEEMKAASEQYPYLEGHWEVLEKETDIEKLTAEVLKIVNELQILNKAY